jgi:tetratricopeptide (TPR) repeat protein
MLLAAPTFLTQPSHSALLSLATQELSPTKIRQSIADLVGQNRIEEADTLSAEALKRFPKSEDILVIRALVCQISQDWPAASSALEKLIDLQGHASPAATWGQWVRVLRCMGDHERAMTAAAQGLANHPNDPALQEAFVALQQMGIQPTLKVA